MLMYVYLICLFYFVCFVFNKANGKMNFSVNALKSKLFGENEETRYAKIETMDSDINDAVLHCQNADIRVK